MMSGLFQKIKLIIFTLLFVQLALKAYGQCDPIVWYHTEDNRFLTANLTTGASTLICSSLTTNDGSRFTDIGFAPDGNFYAVGRGTDGVGDENRLYLINTGTCGKTILTRSGGSTPPASGFPNSLTFLPDGTALIGYNNSTTIYRLTISGSNFSLSPWYTPSGSGVTSAGGDFILLGQKIYVSMTSSSNNLIYEISVNSSYAALSTIAVYSRPISVAGNIFGMTAVFGKFYGGFSDRTIRELTLTGTTINYSSNLLSALASDDIFGMTTVNEGFGRSNPTISAGGTTTFCASGSVVFTSDVFTGNQWYRNGVAISGANGVTYTATQAGTYTVQVTYSSGCLTAYLNGIVVTINTPATPTVTTVAATCSAAGTVTVSNYNPAFTYNFSPAGPTVGAGGVISNATAGTSYTLTSSNGSCTSASSSAFTRQAQLSVPATPTITIVAATCSAAGTATVSNYNPVFTYSFSPTGPTVGAGGVISNATAGTSYTLRSSNGSCTSASSSAFTRQAQLTVPATPTVTTVAATCSVAGTATVSNYNPVFTYNFSPTGPTVGAGGVISNATVGTSYTLTSSNGTCTSASSSAFTRQAKLVGAIAGTATANQAITTGTAPEQLILTGSTGNIQWQVSSDNVIYTNVASGGTTSSYSPGILTATRYYRAVVSSTVGCTDISNSVTVRTIIDSDGDGTNDEIDLDDDNDGILDTDEGYCESQTVYTMDLNASLVSANATFSANGGNFNLVYNLTSGTPVAGLGTTFNVPFSYSDFNNTATSVNHTWEGFNIGGNLLSIRPVTSQLYAGLPVNNSTSETRDMTQTSDWNFRNWLATGALDKLGTFTTTIGNIPTPTNQLSSYSSNTPLNLFSTFNLVFAATSTGGYYANMQVQSNAFIGTGAATLDYNASYEQNYIWDYTAFNNNPATNAPTNTFDRGLITITQNTITFCNHRDTDGDGIPNYLDLDSDNDGCPDANEYYGNVTAIGTDGNNMYGNGNPPAVNSNGQVNGASYTGNYSNVAIATLVNVIVQPSNVTALSGSNANFTIGATDTNTTTFSSGTPNYSIPPATNGSAGLIYQWQVSTDGGTTWVNITNGGQYSGATTVTLTVSNLTPGQNGNRFRAVVSHTGRICSLNSNSATLTINNSAPVANPDTYNMAEDGIPVLLTPLLNDTDVDGTTPTIASINGVTLTGVVQSIPVTNGSVNISAGGVITFTPITNYNGPVSIPYVITDGTATATANISIIVTAVNDAPVANNDSYSMVEDGTPVTLTPLTNDTDIDGTTPSIQSINGTALAPGTAQSIPVTNGTVNITDAGVITFTPTANYNGSVSFPYVITDGTATATASISITLTAVNDAPVANPDSYNMAEDGTPVTLTPLTNVTDVDGITPTITSINGVNITPGTVQIITVPNGTVNITAGGTITFTPTTNYNGPVSFPYVITDGTATSSSTISITVTPVNDAPIANNDSYSMVEDGTPITITPLTNDTDIDVTTPSIQSINGTTLTPGTAQSIPVTNGTVSITAGGTITFTPTANYNGPVSFPYVITDGTATATANISITITAVNDAPVANPDTCSMVEDGTPVTLTPLTNDTDVDGTPTIQSINGTVLTGTAQSIPVTNGTVNITAGGVITFVPTTNYNGPVSFPYVITDGTATATADISITITAVNDAPVANNDSYSMAEDGTPVTLTPLTNDTDIDVTTPSIQSINGTTLTPGTAQNITVTNGTVNITDAGVITFTPTANYNGPVSFPYVITDGTATATANISITVTPVNDAPVANPDTYSMAEDGTPVTLMPLTNDTDVDGTTPTIASINGVTRTPVVAQSIPVPNGTVNITAAGVITFTPTTNYNGPVSFPYVITDGTATASSTISITVTPVNDAPVANPDSYSMAEDGASVTLTPLTNDTDVDGTSPTIASINGVTRTPGTAQSIPVTNGTVNITAGGVISFTPTANYNGPVSFAYVITDGTATATANISITVTAVNDAPLANNDSYSMAEDGTPVILTPLTNDTDVDGTIPTITSINGVTRTPGTAQSIPVTDGTVNITAGGVITFTPTANYNGGVSFPYVITDDTATATADISITVTAVNDAPLANNDSYSMAEDGTPVTLTPLTNDTDVDGTTPTIASINGVTLTGAAQSIPVTNGTVNITAGGTITFTPTTNYNGPVSFPYVITDGTATTTADISITVTAVNDVPVANPDTYSMAEDGVPVTLTPLTNDMDVDGTIPTIQSINGTTLTGAAQSIPVTNGTVNITAGGVISFTPTANYNGPESFPYVITDGTATATANISITVTAVNDAPVANNDTYSMAEDGTPVTITPLTNDTDVDGTIPTITSINGVNLTPGTVQIITVPNGTVNITAGGTITFTPTANYNGPVSFPYVITDGTATSSSTISITVTAVNDAPVANPDTYSMDEDGTPVTLTPLTNDTDVDGTIPTITSINGVNLTPGTAQNITVTNGTVNITDAGVITFTPTANYNGSVSFPYVITDGTATATADISITVTAVNDVPVANPDTYSMAEDGVPVTLTPLTNDTDVDGATPTIQSINGTTLTGAAQSILVTNGMVNITAGGVITFTPTSNYNGPVSFPYVITDGTATAGSTISITVTAVNDAPVANNDSYSMAEDGTPVTLTPLTNDIDVDGTTPTIASINGVTLTGAAQSIPVTNGTVNITAGGTITFTPTTNYNGPVSFHYVITDGTATAKADISIRVTAVNDAPVANNDSYSMVEDGTPVTLTPLTNDTDLDGTIPTIASINGVNLTPGTAQSIPVTNGTVNITAGGLITVTPTANYNGPVSFPYVITDGTATATANISITVTPVNDAPVANPDSYSMAEDGTPVTLTPLTNDTDVDGTIPTITSINGVNLTPGTVQSIPVTNGTVNISAGGVITFAPNANYNGSVSFPYVITDGTATSSSTISITVTPVNDAPIASAPAVTTPQNTPVNGVIAVTDVDGDTPIFSLNTTPLNGTAIINGDGTYTYVPKLNFTGTDSFVVEISDGNGGETTITIDVTITAVNTAPIATSNAITTNTDTPVNAKINASDADEDTLFYAIVNPPLHGTVILNTDGSYTYSPAPGYSGTDSFTASVSDGRGGVTTVTIPLIVNFIANPAIAIVKTGTFSQNFITYTFVIKNTGNVPLYNFSLSDNNLGLSNKNIEAPSGLMPGENISVSEKYILTQGDKEKGTVSNTATVSGKDADGNTVTDTSGTTDGNNLPTITAVPKPFVATNDNYETNANQPSINDVLNNDNNGNVDKTKLTIEIVANPTNGKIVVNPDGTITYTPNPGYYGQDIYSYRIKDEYGYYSNVATVNVKSNFFDVFVPTLFTPNGDGINDTFEIRGLNQFTETQLNIVNRWGNEVYHMRNYRNNWTGEGLNEGTYYFVLRVKKAGSNEWQTLKGYTTLIRAFKK